MYLLSNKYKCAFLIIFIFFFGANYLFYIFTTKTKYAILSNNLESDLIITSSLIGNMRFYFNLNMDKTKEIIGDNHENYATLKGYKYIQYGKNFYNKDAKWEKIYILQNLLKTNAKYIFWIDGDTGFINCNKDVMDIISKYPNKDIIISGDHNFVINSGVFVIKNTEWTKKFIDDLIYIKENEEIMNSIKKVTTLHDQAGMIPLVMGFDPYLNNPNEIKYYFKKGEGNSKNIKLPMRMEKHIEIIDRREWNSYYGESDAFILHCAGNIFCKTNLHNIINEKSSC